MKKTHPILLRVLGLAHIGMAIVYLPNIMFFPLLFAPLFLPFFLWFIFLGGWLWRPGRKLKIALRRTHYILVPYALFLIMFGTYALYRAHLSAEKGGGLMGSFGLIPLTMGILSEILSIATFAMLYSTCFEKQKNPLADSTLYSRHE